MENLRASTFLTKRIYDEVLSAVRNWQQVANKLGISRNEQLRKQEAFSV